MAKGVPCGLGFLGVGRLGIWRSVRVGEKEEVLGGKRS